MKTRMILLLLVFVFSCPIFADILAREGQGFLEQLQGQQVLHLKGTSYERGYQHGVLLKDQIKHNLSTYIDSAPKSPVPGRVEAFMQNIPTLMSHVPDHFKQEMQGVADGSGMPIYKIIALNLFPEMFHCSGMTFANEMTMNHEVYHVRILEYSVGKHLQETAVLQVVEPQDGIPFLSVSYAGFIGTITGMNQQKISIGQIGGLGYGSWNGIPMAFLLRDLLEQTTSLAEIKTHLENSPRTCEYYYIFADGKTQESIAFYATASQLKYVTPGMSYALIAPSGCPANYKDNGDDDKFALAGCTIDNTPYQSVLFQGDGRIAMVFHRQPENCLLLTPFIRPERYPSLVDRVLANFGKIDEKNLIEIVKQPVSAPSNLHTAIFLPSQLKVWIAHAGPNDEPACDQPYVEWDFNELLQN